MNKRKLLLTIGPLLVLILVAPIFIPLKTIYFRSKVNPVCLDFLGNPVKPNAVKRFSVLRGQSADYNTAAKQLKTTNTAAYTQAYDLFCQTQGSDTQYKLYLY